MRTTNIIGILIALALAFACALGLSAKDKDRVVQTRKVENFTAVEITSVASVYFTQDDTYSLRIEGKEKYVLATTSEVSDGKLVIGSTESEQKRKGKKDGVEIYLSAPTLESVTFTGVGGFVCESPLQAGDIRFDVEGVGRLKVDDLHCDRLTLRLEGVGGAEVQVEARHVDASLEGVGSVTLSGTTDTARIRKGGIGSVNIRNLTIREQE